MATDKPAPSVPPLPPSDRHFIAAVDILRAIPQRLARRRTARRGQDPVLARGWARPVVRRQPA